ncbi:MAG: S1 RNA-binding domain-containing protein [Candidatus Micrarchaeia archaeon]|jgi:translation initiation factor 2 subunit 1
MAMTKDMPEQDELVQATVRKIMPYGAFCTLDEYGNREAFLHISEVASRWIKNIREFLREDQHIVARVYKFVPEKNQIDLSLKRVSESDKRRKLEGSKKTKRGGMLLLVAAKKMKVKKPEMDATGEVLVKKWGDVYSAFEALVEGKEAAFEGLELSDAWKKALLDTALENIKKQKVRSDMLLTITDRASNGMAIIKEALLGAKAKEGVEMKITYMGAPKYMLSVTADDFKAANKEAERLAAEVCEKMIKAKGEAAYEAVEKA